MVGKKILVGLSGGVDSSVTALLLKDAGHEVIGVTMRLWHPGRYIGGDRDACFGQGEEKDIKAASEFAARLGISYYVHDCSEAYEQAIVRHYRETKLSGRTPNPCVFCNATMKFGLLPELMRKSGIEFDYFATGHYARLCKTSQRYFVCRATDVSKDQSYFLYRLSQEQLAAALFPLGELTKREVRQIAKSHDLMVADKPDSQDFYSGDVTELLGQPSRKGIIADIDGREIGEHDGYWNFTIGQRKGLRIGGGTPYYVVSIDACKNRVIVGERDAAYCHEFGLTDIKWMAQEQTDAPISCYVKIRSTGKPQGPVILERGVCCVKGKDGLFGIAPGQSAVFYGDNGEILCGGIIESKKPIIPMEVP